MSSSHELSLSYTYLLTRMFGFRLSRIVRLTLRKLYNDRLKSEEEELEDMAVVDNLAVKIADWEDSLPGFLKTKASGSLLLIYARYNLFEPSNPDIVY